MLQEYIKARKAELNKLTDKFITDREQDEIYARQDELKRISNLVENRVSQPSELLPCPFCGGIPTLGSLGGDKENWMIYCDNCKMANAEMGVSGDTLEEIKKNWNKRASQ